MGDREPTSSVNLLYVRDEKGVQSADASISEQGDLKLEAWDYGRAVADTLDGEAHEWEHVCTVRSAHIPMVRSALDGEPDEDVLRLLSERLDQEDCRRLSAWLKHHEIPFEEFSWTTD